MNVYFCY